MSCTKESRSRGCVAQTESLSLTEWIPTAEGICAARGEGCEYVGFYDSQLGSALVYRVGVGEAESVWGLLTVPMTAELVAQEKSDGEAPDEQLIRLIAEALEAERSCA